MTRQDPYDDSSTRVTHDDRATGTTSGADVTSRMTGTHDEHRQDEHGHDEHGHDEHGHDEHGVAGRHAGDDRTAHDERYEERVRPARYKSAKTSVAAVFALIFGFSALITGLTGILAPVAVLFGLIGIALGVAGMKKGALPGVTGKGVAIGGLVMAVLGLLLGAAVLVGAAVFVNESGNLDRLQGWIDDARSSLPSSEQIVEEIPGS